MNAYSPDFLGKAVWPLCKNTGGCLWSLEPGMPFLALAVVPLRAILIRLFGRAIEDAAMLRSDLDGRSDSRMRLLAKWQRAG